MYGMDPTGPVLEQWTWTDLINNQGCNWLERRPNLDPTNMCNIVFAFNYVTVTF